MTLRKGFVRDLRIATITTGFDTQHYMIELHDYFIYLSGLKIVVTLGLVCFFSQALLKQITIVLMGILCLVRMYNHYL